jgi:hypothetical protein
MLFRTPTINAQQLGLNFFLLLSSYKKLKAKHIYVHRMNAYGGTGYVALIIMNFDASWSCHPHASAALDLGK